MKTRDRELSIEKFCRNACKGFACDKTPWYDREYLRNDVKKIITDRNFASTGQTIADAYTVEDYTLLRADKLDEWLTRNSGLEILTYGTHLLHGRKYYFCIAYR